MGTLYEVPTKQGVAGLLSLIFGDGMEVSECDPPDASKHHVATFIDDDDKLVGLCLCDQQFVAYSGAALSMIPAGVANEMIAGNDITDAMVGNFYEVMNICSKLFMADSGPHLRLDKTLGSSEAADSIASLSESATTKGYSVGIPGYGAGVLAFVVS